MHVSFINFLLSILNWQKNSMEYGKEYVALATEKTCFGKIKNGKQRGISNLEHPAKDNFGVFIVIW